MGKLDTVKNILKFNAGEDYSVLFGEGASTEATGVYDTRMDVYKPDPETILMNIENESGLYRDYLQPIWKELSADKLNEQYNKRKAYNLLYPIAKWGCNKWYVTMIAWADDGKSAVKRPTEDIVIKVTDLLVERFEREFKEKYYDYMKGHSIKDLKRTLHMRKLYAIRNILIKLNGFDSDESVANELYNHITNGTFAPYWEKYKTKNFEPDNPHIQTQPTQEQDVYSIINMAIKSYIKEYGGAPHMFDSKIKLMVANKLQEELGR